MYVPFWASYMYVRPDYLTYSSVWICYMYISSEYLTCMSVMSILHVRPSWVFFLYVRPEYLTCTSVCISYMYVSVLSILHVRPSENLTCTCPPIWNYDRTFYQWLIILGQEIFIKLHSMFAPLRIRTLPFCKNNFLYFRGVTRRYQCVFTYQ